MKIKGKLLVLGAVGLVAVTGWRFGVWNYASTAITNQSALKIADTREALVSTEFVRRSVNDLEDAGQQNEGQENEGQRDSGYCLKVTNNTNSSVDVLASFEAVDPGTGNRVDGVLLEAVTDTVARGSSIELPIILAVPQGLESDRFDLKATIISNWDGGTATITDYLKDYQWQAE